MSGWTFLAFLLIALVSGVGGMLFGAQWVRDDIAAQARAAAARRRRRNVLPFVCTPSLADQRHGHKVVEGGRQ